MSFWLNCHQLAALEVVILCSQWWKFRHNDDISILVNVFEYWAYYLRPTQNEDNFSPFDSWSFPGHKLN